MQLLTAQHVWYLLLKCELAFPNEVTVFKRTHQEITWERLKDIHQLLYFKVKSILLWSKGKMCKLF